MKAGVFYGPQNIKVEEVEKPEVSAGYVIIRVKAAGICGSDLHFYKGATLLKISPGTVLGHELSGEVVAVGDGVTKVKVGDRVGVEPLIGCGKCSFCGIGEYHLCKELKHIGFAFKGGFAEYAKAPQEKVFKLTENISYEQATLLDSYAVSVHAIHKVRVEVNDVVAIIGGGTLGLTTVQVVKAAGVKKVLVIGRRDEGLRIAKDAGADIIINASKIDVLNEVKKLTGGLGADVVFECVGGNAPTMAQAVQIAKPGGTIGIIGVFTKNPTFDFWSAHSKELSLVFVWSYANWGIKPEFEIALELLAAGKFNAEPLITHKFPLNKINDGFLTLSNKKESNALKVVVIP